MDHLLIIILIALALLFDFLNGFHDSANVVATMISSRAMTPTAALVIAGAATVGVAAIAAAVPFWGPLKAPRAGGHEASWPMWSGPLALGVIGLIAGLLPFLGTGPVVAAAAAVIGGHPAKYAVEPWYGVDLALLLSLTSIAIGIVILWRRLDVRALVTRFDIGTPRES